MATANFFTKDGQKAGNPVTDATVTGYSCDYGGNGVVIMGTNTDQILIGKLTQNFLGFHKSVTIPGTGVSTARGVAFPKDVVSAKDPSNMQTNFAYAIYRTSA